MFIIFQNVPKYKFQKIDVDVYFKTYTNEQTLYYVATARNML